MADVIDLADHQARASSEIGSGLKKASIGTTPPDTSLKRLARLKEASLRPAKMLRRWASEQSAASASRATDIPLASAQRSRGCCSDMGKDISPRNEKSQPEIFLVENDVGNRAPLQCDMGKHQNDEQPEIHLGDWLKFLELPVGEAAEIAGCDQSYISNIIANRKPNINVLYLLRLSEYLGITVNDFYRPLPSKSQLATLKNLSPKAQATILARQQRKA